MQNHAIESQKIFKKQKYLLRHRLRRCRKLCRRPWHRIKTQDVLSREASGKKINSQLLFRIRHTEYRLIFALPGLLFKGQVGWGMKQAG